ncbi:MAG TPA: hypothetical protein VER38_02570 [Candidatus Eisenbacteria bacterium]|nr:hypothetical protein [Candidatus Eisenbacteria bacterium]
MRRKLHEAQVTAADSRARLATETQARAAKEQFQDVLTGLHSLGCRSDEARRAAEFSATLQHAALEERMRAALKYLGQRSMPALIRTDDDQRGLPSTREEFPRAGNDPANAKLVGETARVVVSGWGDHYRRDDGEDVAGREEAS